MASIVNKVKEALGAENNRNTSQTTEQSSHHTGASEPRTHAAHDTATTGAGVGGAHNISFAGSKNNAVGGTGDNRGTEGPATRTDGPHSSNLANKADPRVDSDRDHSKNMGVNPQGSATASSGTHGTRSATTGTGLTGSHDTHHTTGSGITGTHGTHTSSVTGRTGTASHTDGPHSSNLANKADPRVDSDRDHSRNLGANPQGSATTGTHGTTTGASGFGHTGHSSSTTHGHGHGSSHVGGATTGLTGSGGTDRGSDGPASRTDGPHSSNLANKADPRVDSDRDHSRNLGANPHGTATAGTTGSGLTGSHGTHGTTGTTGSGLTGSHGHSGTHTGTGTGTAGTTGATHGTHGTHGTHSSSGPGPAPKTAGPHKSDLLNKMDPRVDSDLDGSKTVGGNKTYAKP